MKINISLPPISPTADKREGPDGGEIKPWIAVSSIPSARALSVTL